MILQPSYKQLESGLIVPERFRPYPIAFDFFAGCGGFSLGFIKAGFEVIGACEFDCSASHTYMVNLGTHPIKIHYSSDQYKKKLEEYFDKAFKNRLNKKNKKNKFYSLSTSEGYVESDDVILLGDMGLSGSGWIKSERLQGKYYPGVKNFFFGDIREFDGKTICKNMGIDVGDLDAMMGGPPCQGFSKAGKQKADDPRNNLVFQYARMICEMKPKTFVMEEVPAILKMRTAQGVPVLDQFLRILEDGNYMSYEAGMKALAITEEDLGKKVKYVVRT